MLEQHKLTDFTLKSLKSFKIQNALYLTMPGAHKSTGSRSLTRSSICRCIHDNHHSTNYGNKFFFYNLKNLFRKFPVLFFCENSIRNRRTAAESTRHTLVSVFFRFMQARDCQTSLFEEYQASHFPTVRWQQRAWLKTPLSLFIFCFRSFPLFLSMLVEVVNEPNRG